MKKSIIILFLLGVTVQVSLAQNITISLPSLPPANTANWSTTGNMFSITVTGTAALAESRMLVFIKSTSGQVVCGSNQPAAAQPTGITPGAPKAWAGQAAVALLGDQCTLPTGSYEFCVQIFGLKNREGAKPDVEKCVPFEIKNVECSPPNNVSPASELSLSAIDIVKPVIFNWTPLVISGRGIIVYRLMIWEVEEGQTPYEALYNNFPIINKDIKGATRYVAPPGTFEKRTAQYVWRVAAIAEDETPVCKNARSEPTHFSILIPSAGYVTPADDSSAATSDSCCANKIIDKGKTVNISPANVAAINQKFNITPVNIKYISAEIVSVKESATDTTCIKCATHENWIYNFISHNTSSWNGGAALNASPVNASSYYPSKLMEWHCNQQGDVQFQFKIPLPENRSGCHRKSTICIRYRFTDVNCVNCEQIICYDITN